MVVHHDFWWPLGPVADQHCNLIDSFTKPLEMEVFDQREQDRDDIVAARVFSSGATRDVDSDKLDYEGFLSPLVLERFAEYMHECRHMSDGSMRSSDNWQLGIPLDVYMKSMFRHFVAVWRRHRGYEDHHTNMERELCALLFNVMGMLHEVLRKHNYREHA